MLTEREIDVLKLKEKGVKQVDIAARLKISQPAVSNFYNNAMKKLHDSQENIRIAREIGVKIK